MSRLTRVSFAPDTSVGSVLALIAAVVALTVPLIVPASAGIDDAAVTVPVGNGLAAHKVIIQIHLTNNAGLKNSNEARVKR
jgi:hypothetical protein